MVAEILPAVGIVSIARGLADVPVIAVLVLLGLSVIAVGGLMVVHSCSCSGAVPLADVFASAHGVVVALASH